MSEYIIEMKNITKRFPGIVANDSVSIQIKKGEIYALLGENGAGKSTLMSMLFGMYEPDEGEIYIRGLKRLDTLGYVLWLFIYEGKHTIYPFCNFPYRDFDFYSLCLVFHTVVVFNWFDKTFDND